MAGPELTPAELRRYARHLVLPEVGEAGQRRLIAARVLIVGAGGLGSPAALYLAAAGVGTIGLVDDDRVDETNLQRQVLFGTAAVGRSKAVVAAERLSDLNPGVRVEPIDVRLTSRNALDILRPFDIVVDGSDNFPTRYLVNDACVLLGKRDVYGAVFRFDGQASVFGAPGGPCYRCLFRDPPPPELVPSCEQAGVIGAIPGIVGTLQALEVIKLVTGAGQPLIGRLVLVDGLAAHVRQIAVQRDPECPVCGDAPSVRELVDYEAFCGGTSASPAPPGLAEIEAVALAPMVGGATAVQLVDVREPWEWQICRLEGAQLIPLRELPDRLGELDRERPVVTYCHIGVRSLTAVRLLLERGFRDVKSLRGGVERWANEVDPRMARY
jgi:molybdopterin/thiamine biosynthesis adenylyltransferase/rhodanese-related sulfurtransferase